MNSASSPHNVELYRQMLRIRRFEEKVLESFSILTTWPNKEMKSIHDRMPVILKPDDEDRWLDPSNNTPESLADLLVPYKDGKLEVYPVSTEVNSARNDYEELIQSLPDKDH